MANFILTAFPLRSYSNPSIHYFTNSYVFRYLTSFFSFFFIYLLPSFIYSYLHSSTLPLYLSLFPTPPPSFFNSHSTLFIPPQPIPTHFIPSHLTGADAWASFEDPFPASPSYGHSHDHEHDCEGEGCQEVDCAENVTMILPSAAKIIAQQNE